MNRKAPSNKTRKETKPSRNALLLRQGRNRRNGRISIAFTWIPAFNTVRLCKNMMIH